MNALQSMWVNTESTLYTLQHSGAFVSILREKTQVYIVALWKNLSSINQRHTIYEGNIQTFLPCAFFLGSIHIKIIIF